MIYLGNYIIFIHLFLKLSAWECYLLINKKYYDNNELGYYYG